MPGLREQADPLVEVLRGVVGNASTHGPITLESILRGWLDDQGRTVEQLRDEGLLELAELAGIDASSLADRLPRGRPRSVAPVLRRLACWLLDQSGGNGDLETLAKRSTEELREGLRSIRGLGPTSVDTILLRAFGRPVFPVSRGAYRVAVRHGWLDPTADSEEARSTFEAIAPDDPITLDTVVQGLEVIAARHCKPAAPHCQRCPLKPLLGPEGPLDVSGEFGQR